MSNTTLTQREHEIMVLAWQCFKTPPEVDYKKLAELANFKNSTSANASYLTAKKKMLACQPNTLTDREREILTLAWQCFKTPVEVDYKKLAEKADFKNPTSANASYLTAKKKLLGTGATVPDSDGGGKKRKKTDAKNPGSEPPKKRTKKALAATKDASLDDHDDDEELAPKKECDETKNEPVGTNLSATAHVDLQEQQAAKLETEDDDLSGRAMEFLKKDAFDEGD